MALVSIESHTVPHLNATIYQINENRVEENGNRLLVGIDVVRSIWWWFLEFESRRFQLMVHSHINWKTEAICYRCLQGQWEAQLARISIFRTRSFISSSDLRSSSISHWKWPKVNSEVNSVTLRIRNAFICLWICVAWCTKSTPKYSIPFTAPHRLCCVYRKWRAWQIFWQMWVLLAQAVPRKSFPK